MQKVIIFGTSSFAKQMHYCFNLTSEYEIVGFALDAKYITTDSFCGLPIYSTSELLKIIKAKKIKCFLSLGYKDMRARAIKYDQLKCEGVSFVSYISPYAACQIETVNIGENSIILANTTVEPFTKIGNNVFIWSGVTICHDVIVNDHNFIAAGTVIGGQTIIDENCFLGFHCTIGNNIFLAKETLVSANSFVQGDTEAHGFYAGAPAVKKSMHKASGIQIN
ncbi:acetyltransferase [Candidatus Colwellia aromaticivorans]|uniref:acetyltransferase n=1 Tax=Candidatus Colwellia aromaticivorans TaxID=2267621 RepID=UPI000DF21C34|nr:acetyltransferase [Candidatus Colwellia aromaticivorans]